MSRFLPVWSIKKSLARSFLFQVSQTFRTFYFQIPAHRTGKKIAIVGSGPSGLAAAAQLNKVYDTEEINTETGKYPAQ